VGERFERIPAERVRPLWRPLDATLMRNYDVLNRFAF